MTVDLWEELACVQVLYCRCEIYEISVELKLTLEYSANIWQLSCTLSVLYSGKLISDARCYDAVMLIDDITD